tara:strand:+ start:176 stop:691 length:516 start_codon:yes stop_codon:yes gene_type:complete
MKNLYKSLAQFNEEVPVIHQDTKGFNYTYANLSAIFKVIKPLLKKHGLSFTQLLNGDSLKTIIFHVESGETLESEVNIPQDVTLNKMNAFQIIGSAITYYRRYSLSAALGLITDKDIDACGDQKEDIKKKQPFTKDKFKGAKSKGANIEMIKKLYDIDSETEKEYTLFLNK